MPDESLTSMLGRILIEFLVRSMCNATINMDVTELNISPAPGEQCGHIIYPFQQLINPLFSDKYLENISAWKISRGMESVVV